MGRGTDTPAGIAAAQTRSPDRAGGAALVGLGALFAGSAVVDPRSSRLCLSRAGRTRCSPWAVPQLLWIAVRQVVLVGLTVAMTLDRRERAVAWFQHAWVRARPVVSLVGTAALLMTGVILALDSMWWFLSERFLLPAPE